MKICLVGSSGGHLTHLLRLKEWYQKYDRVWITFNKKDAVSSLVDEEAFWCYYPTNRNLVNLLKNTLLAIRIIPKIKPDIVITTGAGAAIPFFIVSKCFGAKTIFIEVYDRINKPTITGRILYYFSDLFLVQWEEQKKYYPKAQNWGTIF